MEAEEAKEDRAHNVIFDLENRRKDNQRIINNDSSLSFHLLLIECSFCLERFRD
jgi:hypothetical protein